MRLTGRAAYLLPIAAALLISACAGESQVASAPPPLTLAPTPSESVSPPPIPPIPSGPIGLVGEQPFATYSARTDGWGSISAEADAVRISYSATDGQYTVSLPDYQEGTLLPKSGNGSFDSGGWINLRSTNSDVTVGSGSEKQLVTVTLDWPESSPYTYTSFGSWSGPSPMGHNNGVFAYGIPTAVTDIPVTGEANYTGEIRGLTNGEPTVSGAIGPVLDVFGSVALSFDFAAGTLSGEMKPQIAPIWDVVSLGTYTFRDTVYAPGNLNFSGAFLVPGSSADSFFSGSFTGPQGAELMANWLAPFQDPTTGGWGTMSGVWVARKGD